MDRLRQEIKTSVWFRKSTRCRGQAELLRIITMDDEKSQSTMPLQSMLKQGSCAEKWC